MDSIALEIKQKRCSEPLNAELKIHEIHETLKPQYFAILQSEIRENRKNWEERREKRERSKAKRTRKPL